METDDEVEMELLQDQTFGEYKVLLQLMNKRHLAAFRSLVQRALKKQPSTLDIDYMMPHPIYMTFLDKAANDDLDGFVEFLLEVGADPNKINVDRKRAPIHFAAEAGNVKALKVLLNHRAVNPNILVSQMTALHYAVKADCKDCVGLLLDNGASPNIPNSKGITALHLAAEMNNRTMVQLILDRSKILDLDTYRDRRKETARTLIQKKFPDIRLPEESEKPDLETLLRYYLTANDEASFVKTLAETKELEVELLALLLHLSVEHDLVRATEELLSRAGAESVSLFELAKLAIERAHPRILEKLLERSPRLADRLLLPACQELGVPVSHSTGSSQDRIKCLKLVLSKHDVEVRQEDDKGNSALHYAARAECREALDLLLQKGSYIGHMNSFGSPPLAHIAPDILEKHLDSCLSSTNERTEEYEIIMDYKNLVPHNTECGASDDYFEQRRRRSSLRRAGNACSETEALLYIAENKTLRPLLKHPILASFLHLKYLRIRHVLYLNFLLYLLFFCALVLFVWVITGEAPEPEIEEKHTRNLSDQQEQTDDMTKNWDNHPLLSCLLACSLLYLVIRESLQFVSSPLNYIVSPENWLEVGLIGLTVSLLLGCGREIGALAILLSTWELVILMAQHPRMSTDIEMFKRVTVNFTKFLFLYIFLIVAFAFAFYVLFKGNDNFPNPIGSLFKTVIMLTGELDSGDLPFTIYPVLSRIVFIGFIFLIVIILLNLLNGLAVNDTQEILAEAELVCLVSRARLVAYAERMVVGGGPLSIQGKSCFSCLASPCLAGGSRTRLSALATRGPMRFVARRVLLFPRYLPHARLSVKPLKNYEITLHGRSRSGGSRCSALTMNSVVVQAAKQVLAERDRQSNEDKIIERIDGFEARFDNLESLIKQIAMSMHNDRNVDQRDSVVMDEISASM